jgi:hypothetical protein
VADERLASTPVRGMKVRKLKRRVSIRGVVAAVAIVIVAGIVVMTLRYQPGADAPAEVPNSAATSAAPTTSAAPPSAAAAAPPTPSH